MKKILIIICFFFNFFYLKILAQENSLESDTLQINQEIERYQNQTNEIENNIKYLQETDPGKISESFFSKNRFGAFFMPSIQLDQANFTMINPDAYFTCLKNEFGSQKNYSFGGGFSYDLNFSTLLGIGIKTGISKLNGNLLSSENFLVNDEAAELKKGNITYNVNFNNFQLFLEPVFQLWLAKKFFLNLGGKFSIILENSYVQKEKLENLPPNITFNNGSVERNIQSGELPNTNVLQYGFKAGFGYELPLNKRGSLLLVPEISLAMNLSKFTKDLDWKTNSASLFLSLKYSPQPTQDTVSIEKRFEEREKEINNLIATKKDLELKIEKLVLEKQKLEVEKREKQILTAKIVKFSDKKSKDIKQIELIETSTLKVIPLLNMIFFDRNSSEIPKKYKLLEPNEIITFSENNLSSIDKDLDIYYNILNIIGKRMSENSNIDITLVGCLDATESNAEGDNLQFTRADNISYYLQNVWKISQKRIKIEVTKLPKKFTKGNEEYANEENRRVEIVSDNPELLAPVILKDLKQIETNPDSIFTHLEIKAGSGIKQWWLDISSAQQLTYNEDNKIKTIPDIIPIDLNQNISLFDKSYNKISFQLLVIDRVNSRVQNTAGLDIQFIPYYNRKLIKNTDYNIMEFTILLPFDEPGLTEQNEILINYVLNKTNELNLDETKINIYGYTDLIGSKERNIELSNQRARKVYDFLKKPNALYEGIGPSNKYNILLPEGRFYNRCVEIIVKPK